MKRIGFRFLASISAACGRTGVLARPRRDSRPRLSSRAQLGTCLWSRQLWIRQRLPATALVAALTAATITVAISATAAAATRPRYGGTLRVMLQSAPDTLDIPANATPADYWDAARTLSLIGDTLVRLDAQGRAHPALAAAWQSDPSARHWQITLYPGLKLHDGTSASPAAVAQILGALHPGWNVRPSSDSISIESETAMPSLLAELALPRNLVLKRNGRGLPIGTGPFFIFQWHSGKMLKLAQSEESWAGRPFVDTG